MATRVVTVKEEIRVLAVKQQSRTLTIYKEET